MDSGKANQQPRRVSNSNRVRGIMARAMFTTALGVRCDIVVRGKSRTFAWE